MNKSFLPRLKTSAAIKNFAVFGAIPVLALLLALTCIALRLLPNLSRFSARLSLPEQLSLDTFALSSPRLKTAEQKSLEKPAFAPVTEALAFVEEAPDGIYPIVETTISNAAGIINSTEHDVYPDQMYAAPYPFAGETHGETEPIVLVLHTHATESFYNAQSAPFRGGVIGQAVEVVGYYAYDSDVRSTDNSKNVVAVGDAFCLALQDMGIGCVHCDTQHDLDYSKAYSEARKSIDAYLEEYPSIRYIIDLHRDTLLRADCAKIKPTTVIDGEKCAQVMLVIGTGSDTTEQDHWRDNLALNYKWQSYLGEIGEGFVRPMYLRYGWFNQSVSVGTMLIEVGSCGNTLEEAVRAGAYAGEALGKMIIENE